MSTGVLWHQNGTEKWLSLCCHNIFDSGLLQDSPSGFLSSSPVLRLSPCLHRSLEGLNQELEEVFVKEQGDEELLRVSEGCKIALNLLHGL